MCIKQCNSISIYSGESMQTHDNAAQVFHSFRNTQVGHIAEYIEPVGESMKISDVISVSGDLRAMSSIPVETSKGICLIPVKNLEKKDSLLSSFKNSEIGKHINCSPTSVEAAENINNVMKKLIERKENQFADFVITHRGRYLGIGSFMGLTRHISNMKDLELEKAREIQSFLMRNNLTEKHKIQVKTLIKPANELGGDFYFSSEVYPGFFVTACFDVSGKNISASLTTSMLGAVFSSLIHSGKVDKMKPSEIIQLLNKVACDQTPDGIFITGIVIFSDEKKNEAELYNLGHTPAFVFTNNSEGKKGIKIMNPNILPLGIEKIPDIEKYAQRITLFDGLKIFIYSDGLEDMYDKTGERYGDEKLKKFLLSRFSLPCSEIISHLENEIAAFTEGAILPDDITVVLSEYSL